MKPRVTVVTPTYNEADNIATFVERLFKITTVNITLIAVDDNSPDGTGKILDKLARKIPIEVIHRKTKDGYGSACVAGLRAALKHKPDWIVQMDADLSHDPRALPKMLTYDADLVVGSRYIPGGGVVKWEIWRQWLSRGANLYARNVLGLKTKDVTSGYRCWRPSALAKVLKLKHDSAGYVFLPETAYYAHRLGYKIAERPIIFTQRVAGISKLGWNVFFESCTKLLKVAAIEINPASEKPLPGTNPQPRPSKADTR